MDGMGVTGMSPLAMMSMHEQYPWMKEKKSSRKQMGQDNPHPPSVCKIKLQLRPVLHRCCPINPPN